MRPLDGVRVLDLATFIAGPYAASVLGEFGAEVIKVEHPDGGDPGRRFGTATEIPDLSLAFLSDSRNKVSVTLDLKREADSAKLIELARRSDVLIENFRPGTLEKWGIGPEVLHAANPALVICRITGYGQTGPYRDRPGFARIAHAVGGLTHLAGMSDGPPVTPGSSSLADYFSGMYGVVGIMMALRVAEQTGRGQVIDVALCESIFRILDDIAPAYHRTGIVRGREGRMTRQVCPHGHFECGDGGWVAIACTSDRMWDRLARNVLGRPDLADSHPRTADRLADSGPDRRRGRGVHAGAPDARCGGPLHGRVTCPAARSTRSPRSSTIRISPRAAPSRACGIRPSARSRCRRHSRI